jgi:hypothetical protein
VSYTADLATLVDVLEAAGLRVATRAGDITPPVVFIETCGTTTDEGGTLVDSYAGVWYVYWIPVRGVSNLAADCEALDTVYPAISPITVAATTSVWSSVTVNNDTWPARRFDIPLAGVAAPVLTLKGT